MNNLLNKLKQWAIDNKYFFSFGAILLVVLFVASLVKAALIEVQLGLFLILFLFSLVVLWLVKGGHYGDMDCE